MSADGSAAQRGALWESSRDEAISMRGRASTFYMMIKHTEKQVIMPQSLKRHIRHTWSLYMTRLAANTLHEWPLGGSTQPDFSY